MMTLASNMSIGQPPNLPRINQHTVASYAQSYSLADVLVAVEHVMNARLSAHR